MDITKQDLLEAIRCEIEDRDTTMQESGDKVLAVELLALDDLKMRVESEKPLDFQAYLWLAYIMANHREAQVRDELGL